MSAVFVLDANAFIQAKRRFYPFAVCPGYWKALIHHRQAGALVSIDKVRDELEQGGDDLWGWIRSDFGEENFASTSHASVQSRFSEIMTWVNAQSQFLDSAKEEFALADTADGWLAAYAKTLPQGIVVTLEEHDPNIRRKVPLPNVCVAFDVEFITPFEMLHRLGVRMDWNP